MCRYGIIFDDSVNNTTNVPFIDAIANILRDSKDKEEGYLPEEYKNVIIPMLVITRLDLVLEDTREAVKSRNNFLKEQKDVDQDMINDMLTTASGKPFYNVSEFNLEKLKACDADSLAKNFKEYIKGFSGNIQTLLKSFKFNSEIDKMKKCRVLKTVVNKFWENRELFDPKQQSDTAIGNMFEMVIRKYFATSSNGQFFTPREIIALMMNIILNSPDIDENLLKDGATINVLDMACGTGGMLSVADSTIKAVNENVIVNLYGQESDTKIHAVCLSDILIKGQDVKNIKCANTLYEDCFPKEKMDFILANPPFGTDWKPSGSKKDEKAENLKEQMKKIQEEVAKLDKGKYEVGLPSDGTDCQMMFIQHAIFKLKKTGKACILSNNKPLFTGDVGSGESNIRKWVLDNDYLEAIIKLPGQLFYNTGINIFLNVFTKQKIKDRKNQILLIDASDADGTFDFHKTAKRSAGDKRNELVKEHVEKIVKLYCDFKTTDNSKVISKEDFMLMKFSTKQAYQCDFAINTKRLEKFKAGKLYHSLSHGGRISEEQMNILLRTSEEELTKEEKVNIIKHNIGIEVFTKIVNALEKAVSDKIYYDMDEFIEVLQIALGYKQINVLTGKTLKNGTPATKKVWVLAECDNMAIEEIKAGFFSKGFSDLFKLIAFGFGEHDSKAKVVEDAKGIVFDDDTKDTEVIHITYDMSKIITDKLGDTDNTDNLLYGKAWEREMVQYYLDKEVLPYAENTYKIDDVVYGAEWAFNRQFFVYKPLPKSTELLKYFKELDESISSDLVEIMEEINA